MPALRTENLTKRFDEITAVDDTNISVEHGELLCFLGPSGCGKSTLLRTIAGLETETCGTVYIDGTDVTEEPPYERDCTMVFQEWALFPQKTVLENITFGLKMEGVGEAERVERAESMLETIQLESHRDKRPAELSGGQQQRVALARSLIVNPEILLLDEPLSSLDKRLRQQMQIELKTIHDEFEQTMIHVTHDQDEAFTIADRIAIVNEGEVVQVGDPADVYANPNTEFVEEFLGDTNLLSGTVLPDDERRAAIREFADEAVEIPNYDTLSPGDDISVSLRPEKLQLKTDRKRRNGLETVSGSIDDISHQGDTKRYYVDTGEGRIFVERSAEDRTELRTGQTVTVQWDPADVPYFTVDGDRVT